MARNYRSNNQNSLTVTPTHVLAIIDEIKEQFEETVRTEGNALQFNSEKVFFTQKLIQSDYLCKLCFANPDALKNAFLSVAATGLSMDPTQKLAWIIPQKGSPVYDISYRGMIRVAVDSSIISDAVVDLVFSNDSFKSNGLRASPTHEYDPFCTKGSLIMTEEDRGAVGERGTFRGAYVDYRLPDGSTLVHFVPKDEIAALRAMSNSWKKPDERDKSPWATWPWAMVRKSIVRSGNNILPIRSNKLDRLVHMLDQNDGTEINNGDVAGIIAGQPSETVRQGVMVPVGTPSAEVKQSDPVKQATLASVTTLPTQHSARQDKPTPEQSTQSNQNQQAPGLTPALVKRFEGIAQRALTTKNFSAAYQHINETYKDELLTHVTGLVNKARHEYASGLIKRVVEPGAYAEALEFATTLPDGQFKTNFLPKLEHEVKQHVSKLLNAAQEGNELAAVEYYEKMPDSEIKTMLNSCLYELLG